MKRILSLFLTVCLLLTLMPAAKAAEITQSGVCGENLTWTLDSDGVLTIRGDGPMTDYELSYETGEYTSNSPFWENRSGIKTAVVESGVTSIGAQAFREIETLTSVELPDSITSVGICAFYHSGLERLTIPKGMTGIGTNAFAGCSSLTAVVIPDGILRLEYGAFSSCTSLQSVTIPDSVTSIGNSAFFRCTSLTDVTIPAGVTELGSAFRECKSLRSIVIPDGITTIASYAFQLCSSLESVTIPNSVTHIEESAFNSCSSLTDIYYSGTESQWKTIQVDWSNQPLSKATLHASALIASGSCGDKAFWELSENGLLYIGGSGPMADQNIGSCVVGTELRAQVRSIVVADGITKIGRFAFEYNENAETILLPDSVTAFGQNAFDGCKALRHISLPTGLTSMGSFCFAYCTSLEEIVIPEGVSEIGYSALSNCTSLKSARLPSTLETVDSVLFANCTALEEITFTGSQEQWDRISAPVLYGVSDTVRIQIEAPIASGSCGEAVTWALDENGVLTISGTGEMENYDYESPKYGGHNEIRRVIIEDGVTAIGDHAFTFCEQLEEVTIAPSVETIGQYAFYYCSALHELTLPDSVRSIGCWAFMNSGLQTFRMPDSVTTAEDGAFYNCESLQTVTLSNHLTAISNEMFGNCRMLQRIDIPDSVQTIGNNAFYSCDSLSSITFGSGLRSVGAEVFYSCENIKSMALPASLSSIEPTSFIGCSGLERFDVDAQNPTFRSIDGVLFSRDGTVLLACPGAKAGEYTVPAGVKTIAPWAISYSQALTGLTVPEGVTEIGTYGVYSNRAMEEVQLPSTLRTIGDFAFSCNAALKSIAVPEGITRLGEELFAGCSALESVSLPSTLRELGNSMLSSCDALTAVTIPEGVTVLPRYLFTYDRNLAEVTLPSSLKQIDFGAFFFCRGLKDVYYQGTEAQWNTISIDDTDSENYDLLHAVIHFTEPVPTLTILTQPQDASGVVGEVLRFTVSAEGEGLTYQWQYSKDGGATWLPSSSKTASATCTLASASRDGWIYRCVVSDANGNSVTSETALVTVLPAVTQQPQDASGRLGDVLRFTVGATGRSLTYQWEYSRDGGKTWTNSSSRTATATCTLVSAARDGWLYRCRITDGSGRALITDTARVSVLSGPVITRQPQNAAGVVGEVLRFTVAASGEGLTYQWQYSKDGGRTWLLSSSKSTTATCTLASAGRDGWIYRCAVTDRSGQTVYSAAARVTVLPAITQQPQDASGRLGEVLRFTVAATGRDLSYQWQYSRDGGKNWQTSSSKTTTATCTLVSASRDGWLYRCIVTDANGSAVISATARVTVLTP